MCAKLAASALLLVAVPVFAADRDSAPERQIDKRIVTLLAEEAALIVVGEPVSYYAQDRYGLALNAEMPFEVRVHKVLRGDPQMAGKTIKVGVTRDSVSFRYDKKSSFVFFLKQPPKVKQPSTDPLTGGGWRVVSDYFGVQPHAPDLETLIRSLYEK